jgi:hypothetical protein
MRLNVCMRLMWTTSEMLRSRKHMRPFAGYGLDRHFFIKEQNNDR